MLSASIAPLVRERVIGKLLTNWRGEFRTLSVAFVVLRLPEHADPQDELRTLQDAVRRTQSNLRRFEAHIHQIRADEQGATIIATFGLPPLSHEDDATRAVEACLALHREWGSLGITTSSGIATGRVFATVLRHSGLFTLIGPTMNVAARLMQLNAGVVCDEATIQAGRHRRRIQARRLASQHLKGRASPVVAYSPFKVDLEALQPSGVEKSDPIGRETELSYLREALDHLGRGGGSTTVIEGEAGIGKSTLVDRLIFDAEERGIQILVGYADDTEQVSPYFAWRSIFRRLFGIAGGDDPDAQHRTLVAELGEDAWRAPLLSDVLEIDLSDSAQTLQIAGEARASTTKLVLLDRLRTASQTGLLAVLIEDAHWLDFSSATLLAEIAEAALPLMLVATVRPRADVSESYRRLLGAPNAKRLVLGGLTGAETGKMLVRSFGAARAGDEIAAFVLSRTGGNPLFIGEVASALRDRGLLTVARGEVALNDKVVGSLDQLERQFNAEGVSSTLEGIVISRFDRLRLTEKEVLQAMAVAGQPVGGADLDPLVAVPADTIDEVQHRLVGEFLTESPGGQGYEFRHAVLRDVIYSALAYGDRRRLHGTYAGVLEQRLSTVPAGSLDASIGHHFSKAGEVEQAIPYLMHAAQHALRNFANIEALALASDILGKLRR